MKKFKIITLSILLGIVLIAAAAWLALKDTAPKYSGEIQLSALQDEVKITYDEFGVPYIDAQNANDAYFALGYVHAQERLFQMEMIRRLPSGRLAEILGPDLISVDKSMLSLGIRTMGERSAAKYFSKIDAPFKETSMAYLNGINKFIDDDNLPIEFTLMGFKPEHFVPADIYTTIGYMSLTFSLALSQDPLVTQINETLGNRYLIDLGIDSASNALNFPTEKTQVLSMLNTSYQNVFNQIPLPVWEASNNWAISAKRSKSGKVLLANDTHISYSQPSVWYEAVINYPGFNMAGYYLAGVPFAVMGHNDRMGWGLTIFPFDNMDLYREKQNPENNDQYWVNDHWENYKYISHTIAVKDQEDVIYNLRTTRHGPILNDVYPDVAVFDNSPISFWWAINNVESEAVEALYKFNTAENIEEFGQAIDKVDVLGLNIVYGDTDDNIAWWGTGRIPKRAPHVNPSLILDGASGKDEVLGFYPIDKNPRSINPENGFVHTSNNAPPKVDGIFYPGYYYPGIRADRIEELFESKEFWDVESMKIIQNDNFGIRDYFIVQAVLLPLLDVTDKSEIYSKTVDALRNWDGKTDIKSTGAVIYNQFLYFALENLVKDEMGEELFPKFANSLLLKSNIDRIFNDSTSIWWDNINTPDIVEGRATLLSDAFDKTVTALKKQFGPEINTWQWGKVHTVTHVHPIGRKAPFDKIFNVGPFPKSGSNEVVDKEAFDYNADGLYPARSGPAMRLLMDFANTQEALSIIPTGESGNFLSPHYADQAEMFINGEYKTIFLKSEDIKKKTVLTLKPE
ncbi:MAG: penicillin acylase family protein [Bacteroidales bacterium]|nr:penicillin acylase family protein [Bacteroidales bacterium]